MTMEPELQGVPSRPSAAEEQGGRNYRFIIDEERENEAADRVVETMTQEERDRHGISSDDAKFSYSRDMKDIIAENKKRDEQANSIKTLAEAEKLGMESLRRTADRLLNVYKRQLDAHEKTWFKSGKADLMGDARGIAVRIRTLIDALNFRDGDRYSEDAFKTMLGKLAEQRGMSAETLGVALGETVTRLEEIYTKLNEINSGDITAKYNQGGTQQYYEDIRRLVEQLRQVKFLGDIDIFLPANTPPTNQSYDLDQLVFENWTTAKEEWYDTTNPKNMDTAMILAAKFAGDEMWKPGGKYALYDVDPTNPEKINVNLHNLQLFIQYRVRELMWFQGPDDTINALEFIRIYETPYRSATLFEFLVYDVHKYKQQRTETGTEVNDDYYWFLMYEAYHLSAIEKNFNYGTEAHNSMTDEERWLEFYKKLCRDSKMSNSDRGLRFLRSLSRKNIEEIMSHGKGSFAKWFDKSFESAAGEDWGQLDEQGRYKTPLGELGADGELGQAISDITSMYKFVYELAGGSWNIQAHLDAIRQEEEFDSQYGQEERQLRKLLSTLPKKGKDNIRRRLEAEKRQGELDAMRAKFQDKQNYFFKSLGGEKEILHFMKILTNKYLAQELSWSTTKGVREVADRAGMILSVLEGTSLLSDADRDVIVNELVGRGMDRGLLDKFRQGTLTNSEFGTFFQNLYELRGNRYKKENLNLYTETGTNAKGPLQSMFHGAVEQFIHEVKYKDRLEWTEVQYAVESGRKTPEWMTEQIQNDTSVSGNKFWGRVAHPEAYFTKNYTKLPAGLKETIPIIKSSQSMWNGVVVDALIEDVKTHEQWHESIYYGDFIQRSMNRGRERIVRATFADQSMSVFFTRRVNAPIKMFKLRKETKTWEQFNPAKAFLGYVAGRPYVNEEKLEEEYLAGRLMLSDFLFAGKYPIMHKRLIREWDSANMGGHTTTTEHAMLGNNVFLMEDALMQVPDIKEAIENGSWQRGELLEAMTELAFVGATLRSRAYEALRPGFLAQMLSPNARRRMKELDAGTDYQPQLTTDALNLVRFVLIKSKLGKMGVEKIHVDAQTGKVVNNETGQEVGGEEIERLMREELEYKGQRYNEKVVDAMFQLVMGVPYQVLWRREVGDDTRRGTTSLLWAILAALFAESFKLMSKEIKS